MGRDAQHELMLTVVAKPGNYASIRTPVVVVKCLELQLELGRPQAAITVDHPGPLLTRAGWSDLHGLPRLSDCY